MTNFQIFIKINGITVFIFLEVNHEDFEDCFFKIGVTLNALKDKEIWINMIGGTNQINTTMLTSGGLSAAAVRYYYVFQSLANIKLLHPEINKPNLNNLKDIVPVILNKWHEFPIFHLDIGQIIENLNGLFKDRQKVNIKEIEKLLIELNFPKEYIAKIRGRLIKIDGNTVSKGYMLTRLAEMQLRVKEESKKYNNSSLWEKWAIKNGLLWKLDPELKCKYVKME